MPQESLDRNFTNMNSIHESLEIHVRFVHRRSSDDSWPSYTSQHT